MVRECRPRERELSSLKLARRSTMTTSVPANVSSAASIIPVGPPPAITTACSAIHHSLFPNACQETLHHTRGLAASPGGGAMLRWRELVLTGGGHRPPRRRRELCRSAWAAARLASAVEGETVKALLQELSLGHIIGSSNRCLISCRCLNVAAKPAQHIRSDGVEEVIVFEVQTLEQCQCGVRSLVPEMCDGAIYHHDWTRSNDHELVVELKNLPPVSVRCGRGIRMNRVDRSLDLIRTRLVAPETLTDHRFALGDQPAIPQTPVLGREEKESTSRRGASGSPGREEQHQPEQADDLGLIGHQLDEHTAEPDGLCTELISDVPLASGRCVALVEDQIHDGEHRAKATRQLRVARNPIGDPRVADLGS